MSNAESVKNLLAEIAKLAVVIDQLAERTHRAVTTARDLLEIAQRYVSDGEQDEASDPALTDALVAAEHAVHLDRQRAIEREELLLDRDAFLRDSETTDARRSVNAAFPASSTDVHLDGLEKREGEQHAVETLDAAIKVRVPFGVVTGTFKMPDIHIGLGPDGRYHTKSFSEERTVNGPLSSEDLAFSTDVMDCALGEASEPPVIASLDPYTALKQMPTAEMDGDGRWCIPVDGKLVPIAEITMDFPGNDGSISKALQEAYDAPMSGEAALDQAVVDVIMSGELFETFGEERWVEIPMHGPIAGGAEDPPPSPGEEKTEAAAVSPPQPAVAASVDPAKFAVIESGINDFPDLSAEAAMEHLRAIKQAVEDAGMQFAHPDRDTIQEYAEKAAQLTEAESDGVAMLFGIPPGALTEGAAHAEKLPVEPLDQPSLSIDPAEFAHEIFGEPGGRLVAPQYGRDSEVKTRANKAPSLYEEVLELWATTTLTERKIAERVGATVSLVRQQIEMARVGGDDRIDARNLRSTLKPSPKEDSLSIKGVSAPPPSVPFPSRKDVELGSFDAPAPGGPDISTGICTVDLRRNIIFGKKGIVTVAPEVAKTIAFLNKGECFSVEVVAQQCDWPTPDHLRRAITSMMERLRDIGVVMTNLPSVGLHIKPAE